MLWGAQGKPTKNSGERNEFLCLRVPVCEGDMAGREVAGRRDGTSLNVPQKFPGFRSDIGSGGW